MTARDWVMQFLLGGLFGAAGQGIRVVVGLKKLNDQALRERRPMRELFRASELAVSLLIGFIAGVLAALAASIDVANVEKKTVLLLIGAGYSGADFIEGFVKKYLPGESQGPPDPDGPPHSAELPPVG
jgi:hypothetical protein